MGWRSSVYGVDRWKKHGAVESRPNALGKVGRLNYPTVARRANDILHVEDMFKISRKKIGDHILKAK
jgi:hypothetical protein